MATQYKTPGVYVDEIPKFPPSVAAVETAIPAFIGYTEKADKLSPGDLLNIPTRIASLAEYEVYFGVGANPSVSNVTLDDGKNFKSAALGSVFYMYDSLRLFYANGGGDCYIVAVATYDAAAKTAGEFTSDGKGIKTLEKVDDPTILVLPDNSLLATGTDFYTVYAAALAQCNSLMDRVGLFQLKEADPKGTEFRNTLSNENLKYGATYTPWLTVNFPKTLSYRQFKDVLFVGSTKFNLADLTTDAKTKALIVEYEQLITDSGTVDTANLALATPSKTLREQYTVLEGAYQTDKTPAKAMLLVNFLFEVARKVDVLVGASGVSYPGFKTDLKGQITSTLKSTFNTLVGYDKELAAKITSSAYTARFSSGTVPSASEWGDTFNAAVPPGVTASNVIPAAAANNTDRLEAVVPLLKPLFETINNAWLSNVVTAVKNLEKQKHDALLATFPLYKSILTGLQNTNTNVPPSGAVAGIYAAVDRNRGVWKAPANVGVTGIIGPKDSFTASELDALNIDVNSGKSINAIRSFTGKGTLVYGARTLAGNDNEWRYVSVRRFFNFVEESVKKATEQFVFEPNDANTWVKLQAMIENFLTTLWRQGALQGIKPEHAFYVAVGLGKTMTALDILEGRLVVEIGLAAVRPAEFIILKFSHKMAES
jgi:phage tail sheath protein FI